MKLARLVAILLLLLLITVAFPAPEQAAAETRRALLIGIDRYDHGLSSEDLTLAKEHGRRVWPNLQGSVNDATAIREILIKQFSFDERNVVLLTDEAATRSRIISEFNHHLIDRSQPGDHIVLFYAGHGSRVRNSNSPELDKKDETIVPADANRGDGRSTIVDIRDKEWDRLFTRALDKGLRLTAIFDSCHSGSISRGVAPHQAGVRFLEEDERDVAQLIGPESPSHQPGQEPEKREGALVISAAQEDQFASEAALRSGEKKEWHGAFTLALMDTLQHFPTDTAAERLFDRVTAKLKAMGLRQDPILAGLPARRHAPLFGNAPVDGPRELHLNVVHTDGADDIELQGGLALGLRPGTELVPTHSAGGPPLRLRITQVRDLLRSQAAVIQGNWKSIRSGDEFEVVHWGSLPERTLKIYIPPPTTDETSVLNLSIELRRHLTAAGATWVEDPAEQAITHLLAWTGKQWTLTGPTGPGIALGPQPESGSVLAHLPIEKSTVRLFMNLPPSANLRNILVPVGRGGEGRAELTQELDDADYLLVGRAAGPRSEHAWMLRTFTSNSQSTKTSTIPLPVRTAWGHAQTLRNPCTDGGLKACLPHLAKLYHWLNVESPADDRRFPYRLGFVPLTPAPRSRDDQLPEGTYQLVLESDQDTIAALQANWGVQARYVYVFVIDQDGRSTLLFPNDASKEREHLLPQLGANAPPAKDLVRVSMGESAVIQVHAPFGNDTYVMLSSNREIPRVKELVEADAVDSSARRMRGQTDWSISRRFLQSVPATSR